MKILKISIILLIVILLCSPLFSNQDSKQSNEKKVKEIYLGGKKYVYGKKWSKAIEKFNRIVDQYQGSKYMDESLYWLGYSMNRYSRLLREPKKELKQLKRAFSKLEHLIKQYSKSKWVDDAKMLRIEIAEKLVKNGQKYYEKYIIDDARKEIDWEGMEALKNLKSLKGLENLGDVMKIAMEAKNMGLDIALKTLDSLENIEGIDEALESLEALKNLDNLEELKKLESLKEIEGIKEVFKNLESLKNLKGVEKALKGLESLKELEELVEKEDIEDLEKLDKIEDLKESLKDLEALKELDQLMDLEALKKLESIKILEGLESEADLKMVALNALLQMDKNKALPILKKIIREKKDPKRRENAILILSQINDPTATVLLTEIAKDEKEDAGVREKAIFWLRNRKNKNTSKTLMDIYRKTENRDLKEILINSIYKYGNDKAARHLIKIYKIEESVSLKKKIIFLLGQSKSKEAKKFLVNIVKKEE